MEKNTRRDLELILVGVALAKSERDRVLSLGAAAFTGECSELMDAIARNNPHPVMGWLKERGVVPEKGRDVIDMLIHRIADMNERERLKALFQRLSMCHANETVEQMKARAAALLRTIEQQEDVA